MSEYIVYATPIRVMGLEQWQAVVVAPESRQVLYAVVRWSELTARREAEAWAARCP